MLYKLTNLKLSTTKSGKQLLKASTLAADSSKEDNVTLWASTWSGEANWPFNEGAQVEGELKKEQNGQYENKTLFPPYKKVDKTYPARTTKPEQIAVAQANKAEYISAAQDKKEKSIAYFSSLNASIEVVKARLDLGNVTEINDYQIQQEIGKWRDFFFGEWKKHSEQPF